MTNQEAISILFKDGKTVTRHEFNQMDRVLGGDLWNQWKSLYKAFEYSPEVTSVTLGYIGTGLWRDVLVQLVNGETKRITIYG